MRKTLKTYIDLSETEKEAFYTLQASCFPEDIWSPHSCHQSCMGKFSHSLFLIDADQVVAYLIYQKIFETAEILSIAVAPTHRGQEIGLFLLSKMHHHLTQDPECTEAFLEVAESNNAARKIYQKAGYELVTVRQGYYICNGQKENGLVLKKTFLDNSPNNQT